MRAHRLPRPRLQVGTLTQGSVVTPFTLLLEDTISDQQLAAFRVSGGGVLRRAEAC